MRSLRKRYWLPVGYFTLFIYATLPVARPISDYLKRTIPFGWGVNFFVLTLLGLGVIVFLRQIRVKRNSTFILLGVLLIVYVYFFKTIKIPEEKIHFIEYGFLASLIVRALRLDIPQGLSYFLAFILTSLLGWIDEGIQYLLPDRYYDLRDITFNILGGLLGLFANFILRRGRGLNTSHAS